MYNFRIVFKKFHFIVIFTFCFLLKIYFYHIFGCLFCVFCIVYFPIIYIIFHFFFSCNFFLSEGMTKQCMVEYALISLNFISWVDFQMKPKIHISETCSLFLLPKMPDRELNSSVPITIAQRLKVYLKRSPSTKV